METVFIIIGGSLAVLAVLIAFIGLRNESFPSPAVMKVGIPLFIAVVAAAATFAVISAREEERHRNEELAAEEGDHGEETEPTNEGGPANGKQTSLDIDAPADGSLVFEPDTLEAPAGEVTINFDNLSDVVPHNVVIESPDGAPIAESPQVTGEKTDATADLEAGTYAYYCAVPGHRPAGMEGVLTVR